LQTSDFYYDLPQELIAQTPLVERAASRLLVYERQTGGLRDTVFSNIVQYLRSGDALVRNTTRVIPARLFGARADTGGVMEFLLLRRIAGNEWEALVKPGRRAKPGLMFRVNDELSVTILSQTGDGGRIVQLHYNGILEEVLDRGGHMPLPPYIHRKLDDKERYQTVYANENGSAAAPTAGLHFTSELFEIIKSRGVEVIDVLLHVGPGTFRPVSAKTTEEHKMHAEYYEITEQAARAINAARARGGRVISVGTTVCRALESVANENGAVHAQKGWTDIFITPGYRFCAIDGLITNFHLPKSTLLMLVSAFAAREGILRAYRHAILEKYRFFSFGDAMFITDRMPDDKTK
jgi:S-adenosylmethionine:tRNA ribosyltransferase-isomerase